MTHNTLKVSRFFWTRSAWPLLLAIGLFLGWPVVAAANTITVDGGLVIIDGSDGRCSLIEAIINANTNAATHADCAAGSASSVDLISLSNGNYALTLTSTTTYTAHGRNGLPSITDAVIIEGNGATIERVAATTDKFRILHVADGISVTVRNLTMRNGFVSGSISIASGGAVHNRGRLWLNGVTVRNNQASYGGGIYNQEGQLTLVNSTVSNNRANSQGGGLLNLAYQNGASSAVSAQNATIANNISSIANGGGGLANYALVGVSTDVVTVTSSFKNSLIANNTNGDCANQRTDLVMESFNSRAGYNLSSDGSCFATNAGNVGGSLSSNRTASPNIGGLGDNGGQTATHALLAGSPAIDSGVCSLTVDQRGQPRNDGLCDIGAYESTLAGEADLSIAKRLNNSHSTVYPSQNISYTLQFTNSGPNGAKGVVITDWLPLTLTHVTYDSSGATVSDAGVRPGLVWNVSNLPVGSGGIITVMGRISSTLSGDTTVINQATITATQSTDTVPANNQATAASVDVVVPQLTLQAATASERDRSMIFTVTLNAPSPVDIQVDYATRNGTAQSAADYVGISLQTLLIPATQTVVTIPVSLLNDSLYEGNEQFFVSLSNPVKAGLAVAQATGTIIDDETGFELRINDPTAVTEGGGPLQFSVTISPTSGVTVTVDYTTQNITAIAGNDYTVTDGTLTFPPNVSSRPIPVPIINDNSYEPQETFAVNLSNPNPAIGVLVDNQGLGTIIDNDSPPQLTVGDAQTVEGGTLSFVISLTEISGFSTVITYQTVDGSAVAAQGDYTPIPSAAVTIPAGSRSGTVNVTTLDDTVHELTETLTLRLLAATNATLADSEGRGSIVDDGDPVPTITPADGFARENEPRLNIPLTFVGSSGLPITLTYSTQDGSAVGGSDYISLTRQRLIIPPNVTRYSMPIRLLDDSVYEGLEQFIVTIDSISGATTTTTISAAGIITDDEAFPLISVRSPVSVTEGVDSQIAFTVNLSPTTPFTVEASYQTVDGTATSPADYAGRSGRIIFVPGASTIVVTTSIRDDLIFEGNEHFSLTLSSPLSATLGQNGRGIIIDNEAAPTVSISNTERLENEGPLRFTVTLSLSSSATTLVSYQSMDGSASSDSDYTAVSGTVTIPPGDTQTFISVPITNDTRYEGPETVRVRLTDAVNGSIGNGLATGWIIDNDLPPTVNIANSRAPENSTMPFTLTLSSVSAVTTTIILNTVDGTATAGSDYIPLSNQQRVMPPNTISQVVMVTILADTLDEVDEQFSLTMTTVISGRAGSAGIGTIEDSTPSPTITVTNETATEGAGVVMNFTVSLTESSARPITVSYTTQDGSAVDSQDYAATNGTLIFAPGETSKTIAVPISDDLAIESVDEQFRLRLTVINAEPTSLTAIGTIVDNEPVPGLEIIGNIVNEAAGQLVFTLRLTGTGPAEVIIDYVISDGAAVRPDDYTISPITNTITIPVGSTAATVTATIVDDNIRENTENFFLTVVQVQNANIVGNRRGSGLIIDNDDKPITVFVNDQTQTENLNQTFTLSLTQAQGIDVTINYTTTAGSATANQDYSETSGSVTLHAGDTTASFTIPITDDLMDELDETFQVTLNTGDASLAVFTNGQQSRTVSGTILDNDDPPNITVSSPTVWERAGRLTFTVELSAASSFPIRVDYATIDGTALATSDYVARSGRLTFTPGITKQQVTVTITDDLMAEPTERFELTLSNPINAHLSLLSLGVGTILDDDSPPGVFLMLSSPHVTNGTTVREGQPNQQRITVTIRLTAPFNSPVAVTYRGQDGTATATDYQLTDGTITFNAGQTSATVPVEILNDSLHELTEQFSVRITHVSHGNLLTDTLPITILDDDPLPELRVADGTVGENNGPMIFTASLNRASGVTVSLTYTTTEIITAHAATADVDYQSRTGSVTIAPGNLSSTFAITVNDDRMDEPDERFGLMLGNNRNSRLINTQAVGTIIDDDDLPQLSVSAGTVLEAALRLPITFTLSASSSFEVVISYTTQDGSARSTEDYVSQTDSITIPAGQSFITTSIVITNDGRREPLTETVRILVTAAHQATISSGSADGQIIDDDEPTISVSNPTANEGDGQIIFTVTASPVSALPLPFTYLTVDGTALSSTDYLPVTTSPTMEIAANTATQTVTISLTDDNILEPTEGFTLMVTTQNPITTAWGVGTILDNDAAPGVVISDSVANERERGITFTLTLTEASGFPVVVRYTTLDDTALSSSDYVAQSGSLTFAVGTTALSLTIPLTNDDIYESTERFILRLTHVISGQLADNQAIGTIIDDEVTPTLTISGSSGLEGQAVIFTVSSDVTSSLPITVGVALSDGSATAATDYAVPSVPQLTFPPNQTWLTFTVSLTADALFEPTETFSATLQSNPINAQLGSPRTAIGTILDNTVGATISISDSWGVEGVGQTLVFTVSSTVQSSQPITVAYQTLDGSAKAGTDYQAMSGTLTIPANRISQTLTIPLIDDSVGELDEQFSVTLLRATPGFTVGGPAIGTIRDDDVLHIGIGDAQADENNGPLNFAVQLSFSSSTAITIPYATMNGTAIAGSDYTAVPNGELVIPAGHLTGTIAISITDDAAFEQHETMSVTIALPSHVTAVLSNSLAIGTIINDDAAPTITLVGDSSALEGAGGIPFRIELSDAFGYNLFVLYQTASGTATADEDYPQTSQGLVITAGNTLATFTIPISEDTLYETDETFTVRLSSPEQLKGVTILTPSVTGTIINDDPPPGIVADSPTITEAVGAITVTVQLTAVSGVDSVISYLTVDDTALASSDYTPQSGTMTIPAGELTGTIRLSITDDNSQEPVESFNIRLTGPNGNTLTRRGTIIDDDGPPNITMKTPAPVDEGAGRITFTLALTAISGFPVTVNYRTASGTATAGADFGAASGSIVIPSGRLTVPIGIVITDDLIYEREETFRLMLGPAISGTLITPVVTGTILDNETPPVITISQLITAAENGISLTFVISLSHASKFGTSFDVATVDGSASAATDYQAVSRRITIPTTAIRITQSVAITDDNIFENNEQFRLILSNPTHGQFANMGTSVAGIGLIIENDPPPGILIADGVGSEASQLITFTIRLTGESSLSTTVVYSSSSNTATDGVDYQSVTQSRIIPAGTLSTTVVLAVVDDDIYEATEQFSMTAFSQVEGAAGSTATGTILDNDDPPTVEIGNGSEREDVGQVGFAIRLSRPSRFPITLTYTATDGTAQNGRDYQLTSPMQHVIPPLTTLGLMTVTVITDKIVEADEVFSLTLSIGAGVSATLAVTNVTGTIINDDSAGISVMPLNGQTVEGSTPQVLTVTLTSRPTASVVVNLTSQDVTEGVVTPTGHLTFLPATWNVPQTTTVVGQSDGICDLDVRYSIRITSSSGDLNYAGRSGPSVSLTSVDVNYCNKPPWFLSRPTDLTILEDEPTHIPFRVFDPESVAGLHLTGDSTNPTLLSPKKIGFAGSSLNRGLYLTPNADQNGQTTITVYLSDGEYTVTSTFTLIVLPVDDAPRVTIPITDQTVYEDKPFTMTLAANSFTDPDEGDVLTYSATLSGGSRLPSWLMFNPATQTFSGTATNDDIGLYTITVTAIDTTRLMITDTFVLTVVNVNDRPMLTNALPDVEAFEDRYFVFRLPPNSFTDIDVGDVLTYTVSLTDGRSLPSWLTFDHHLQFFSGRPAEADVGQYPIRVQVTDSAGESAADVFVITVFELNDVPVVTRPISDQITVQDKPYRFTVAANTFTDDDADDVLTYTAVLSGGAALPAWLKFDAASRTFSGTPSNNDVGTIIIQLIATDLQTATPVPPLP